MAAVAGCDPHLAVEHARATYPRSPRPIDTGSGDRVHRVAGAGMGEIPRDWPIRLAALLVVALLWIGAAALAWGSWAGLMAHPARRGAVAVGFALSAVAAFAPFTLSTGKRADLGDIWIFVPGLFLLLPALFLLPPYLDARERWVIDGDAVRWLGLVLFTAGGVLRLWPLFVLGPRFSGFVAIQEGHTLVTGGVYRWIRHPSYAGMLLNALGWVLLFRSAAGLCVLLPFTWLLLVRIRVEEGLLTSEFGGDYEAYRRRTWTLMPGVY
jgi:protein-S-isoprenylcysteine O-methyltransferase Ste14